MIYRITFYSEESDSFKLVFEADSEATFLDLHKAILAALHYSDDQMTSFFLCDDRWERSLEITLVEMDSADGATQVMEDTHLNDLLTTRHQKFMFVFDPLSDRYLSGDLALMKEGNREGIALIKLEGKAPKQLLESDPFDLNALAAQGSSLDLGTDMYGTSDFNSDELDMDDPEGGFHELDMDNPDLF